MLVFLMLIFIRRKHLSSTSADLPTTKSRTAFSCIGIIIISFSDSMKHLYYQHNFRNEDICNVLSGGDFLETKEKQFPFDKK